MVASPPQLGRLGPGPRVLPPSASQLPASLGFLCEFGWCDADPRGPALEEVLQHLCHSVWVRLKYEASTFPGAGEVDPPSWRGEQQSHIGKGAGVTGHREQCQVQVRSLL